MGDLTRRLVEAHAHGGDVDGAAARIGASSVEPYSCGEQENRGGTTLRDVGSLLNVSCTRSRKCCCNS